MPWLRKSVDYLGGLLLIAVSIGGGLALGLGTATTLAALGASEETAAMIAAILFIQSTTAFLPYGSLYWPWLSGRLTPKTSSEQDPESTTMEIRVRIAALAVMVGSGILAAEAEMGVNPIRLAFEIAMTVGWLAVCRCYMRRFYQLEWRSR